MSDEQQREPTRPRVHGPPEPLVEDDGNVKIAHVVPNNPQPGAPGSYTTTAELTALKCSRCGSSVEGTIRNGEIEPPYECWSCERQGPFFHPLLDKDEGLNIETAARAGRLWYPPSAIDRDGFPELWDDTREYIRTYWDTEDESLYDGLTAFVLSTWVRENLPFVPHILLMGKTTGGKTRLLNTLARVSYRAVVSASATAASMFHLIHDTNATFYVSEYHGMDPDAQRELDNVVRAGQKRGEKVTRAEALNGGGYTTEVYDPFTHVALASQYEPADDIVNRCIQIRSSASHDRDMPAEFIEADALSLRNRLLAARYRLLYSYEWEVAKREAYMILHEKGIDGRPREKLLSCVAMAVIWERVAEIEPFIATVVQQDRDAAQNSEDAIFIEALRDLAFEQIGSTSVLGNSDPFAAVAVPYSDVVERIEEMSGLEKSATWVGHIRKRLGFEKQRKTDGTVITDEELAPKLKQHCEENNLEWQHSGTHNPAPKLPKQERGQGIGGCAECGDRDAYLTHRDMSEGGTGARICSDCADDIRAAAEREQRENDDDENDENEQ